MEAVMFMTLLDSPHEFYNAYHGFKATVLEVQRDNCSGVRADPDKILQFQHLSRKNTKAGGNLNVVP